MRTPRQIFEINLSVICPIIRHLNTSRWPSSPRFLFGFLFLVESIVSHRFVWTRVRLKHLRWRANAYKTRSIKIVQVGRCTKMASIGSWAQRLAIPIHRVPNDWPLVKANTIFFSRNVRVCALTLPFMVPHSISKRGTSQWPNNTLSSNRNLVQIQFRFLCYRCGGIVVVIYVWKRHVLTLTSEREPHRWTATLNRKRKTKLFGVWPGPRQVSAVSLPKNENGGQNTPNEIWNSFGRHNYNRWNCYGVYRDDDDDGRTIKTRCPLPRTAKAE